jgi:hypothetical protein
VSSPARFRMSRTALLPVVLLLLCTIPVATATPWTAVLFLVPLVAAVWVVRVGVDVDDEGLTVRSLLGQRRVGWDELAGIRVADKGSLWLLTTAGTQVRLPVLRTRDLPRLAAVSDGRISVPQRPA